VTDWSRLAGLTCTCPPGCTTGNTWGDGPRKCATDCKPCRLMAGQTYTKPNTKKANAS